MRSPALAIGWEFRRRHRWGLIAVAGYLFVVTMIRFLILAPGEPVLVDSGRFAALVSVPLTATFVYLLAVFSFGFAGDLAARQSMYPARMFTLPVTNAALVGWPMLYGTAAMAILWLAARLFAVWPSGIAIPLIWPALLFSFARPGSSVVRVAAAWPVAAGAGGPPAAVRAGVALARQGRAGIRLRNTVSRTDHAAVHGRLHGMDREPAESPGARFLWRAAVHRDAAVDQRRAHRRQAEDGDVEHAGRVAAGARRDAARARVVGHLVRSDGTGAAHA